MTLSKGATTRELSGSIGGFKTSDQAAVNEIDQAMLEVAFNATTFDQKALPSAIAKPNNGSVGTNGVTYAINSWIANDRAGIIIWYVKLTKNNATKLLRGTIKDFRTTSDHNVFNSIKKTDVETAFGALNKTLIPSVVPKPNSQTIGKTKATYSISRWVANDKKGTINWIATISKGQASKVLSGTIGGFKSTLPQAFENKDELSSGQIAGIVVGSIIGASGIGILIFNFNKKHKR